MEKLVQNREIIDKFSNMKTIEDFAAVLNSAKNLFYGQDKIYYTKEILLYFSKPEYSKHRYKQFSISKKSGGLRIIHSPNQGLKGILRVLNFVLQVTLQPHKSATGFVPGKSIVDNAKQHVGKNYVYNIDLADFFHSFDKRRVKSGIIYALKQKDICIQESIAYLIASLCTHPIKIDGNEKYVLPQGSPTSPTLTNILCIRLDRRLNGLAKRFNATYSRYADDITFSSDHNIYNDKKFLTELERIISVDNTFEFGLSSVVLGPKLKLNKKKTRLQRNHGYRQEVTGLIVNEKVNVSKRYIKTIRTYLYQWERYGYEKAQSNFLNDYKKEKGHVKSMKARLENVLEGKLLFLKMVKGENDSTYQKLQQRFEKLTYQKDIIDETLDIWQKEGIEKAMKLYDNANQGTSTDSDRINIADLIL